LNRIESGQGLVNTTLKTRASRGLERLWLTRSAAQGGSAGLLVASVCWLSAHCSNASSLLARQRFFQGREITVSSLQEAHATLSSTMLPKSRWERLRRFFSLQPFGDEMLTPGVQMWLYAAWILVMAMALLEGCAWGWFGSGVASGWPGVVIGIALGGLAFLIIWALDASLMTSNLTGQGVGDFPDCCSVGIDWVLGVAYGTLPGTVCISGRHRG
jgi:hypothetical protein